MKSLRKSGKKKKVRFSDVNLLSEEEEADELLNEENQKSEEEETEEREERELSNISIPPSIVPSPPLSDSKNKRVMARIDEGEFAWSAEKGQQFSLQNINLEIYSGEFIVIVGPVGSGKSSLLAALLHEMHKVNFYNF